MSDRRSLRAAVTVVGVVFASLVVWVASAWAAGAPSIDDQWVSDVGYTVATLHANINPNEAATTYHFEYGPTAAYGTSVPMSDAKAGEGSADVEVTQPLSGLLEGVTYHYRVVASSPEGAVDGSDLTFKTYPASVSTGDSCPNALIRQAQFSSYLPDCRAYELVSPPGNGKGGANIGSEMTKTQAAVSGEAIKYQSITAFGDAQGFETTGAEYVSQRAPDGSGWSTHGINPEQNAPSSVQLTKSSQYVAFSEELSQGVYSALSPVGAGHTNVEKLEDLYLRSDVLSAPPGNYELLSDSVTEQSPIFHSTYKHEIIFVAASRDWSNILFESLQDLTPEAKNLEAGEPKLYEWHAGALRLAGILPSEQPAEASIAGGGIEPYSEGKSWPTHAISSDGSRVVFTEPTASSGGGDIYMRINGEKTVRLNISERTDCADHNPCNGTPEPDPNGEQPAEYLASTPDDTKVFFFSGQVLTNEPDAGLYMYDMNASEGKHLKLLAGGEGGEITGVPAVSENGEYVYFTTPSNVFTDKLHLKRELLYVWHDATIRFIGGSDERSNIVTHRTAWGQYGIGRGNAFRASRDGKTVTFVSSDPETAQSIGYDNHAVEANRQPTACAEAPNSINGTEKASLCREVYVYNYDTNKLVCVSCDPTGARPVSDAGINIGEQSDIYLGGVALTSYLNRPLSEDSREDSRYVFFDTGDALVPQDTNGRRDVYEYDTQTGMVHLITSGVCSCDSRFVDASVSGGDVFFTTRQQLVRADIDGNADMYDARIEGGIPGQNRPPAAECSGEECQGPSPSAPVFSTPASSTFNGVGNPIPPALVAGVMPKSKRLTPAQKLARALKACRKKRGRSRAKCQARARKTYSARRASRRTGR